MSVERSEFELQTGVSRETYEKLDRYVELVKKWSPRINLVGRSTLSDIWTRHILDSAQLVSLCPKRAEHWLDIGSGGGFPGVVVGIMAQATKPELRLTLVESDQRKCAFLSAALRETGVHGNVLCARSEELDHLGADVVSARALAPLSALLGHAERHLSSGGTALFPKGANYQKELINALDSWSFHCETHPSKTDTDAVVFSISEIKRA